MPSASKLFTYLFYFTCDVNMMSLSFSWHWWAATASVACLAILGAVTDWWRSSIDQWPTRLSVSVRASGRHFEHTLWLSMCFSVYLMNFMFHTTLDAVGGILRVHYKSMKCDVSFSQRSVSTLFGWGEHVFHVCVKCSSACSSVKIIKIKRVLLELWSQTYCHVFMNHSVVWP